MKILLGAVISLRPYSAGTAWNWLQHAVGLRRLGHEVHCIEEVPASDAGSFDGERFRSTLRRFGLLDLAWRISATGEPMDGRSRRDLIALARDADLLVNMSGHVRADVVLEHVHRKAYVDQDPVYTQLWAAEYGADLNFSAHDVFVSVGLNVGTRHSPVPTCAVDWRHTLPPIVPELWPRNGSSGTRFTTIASWTGAGELEYRGQLYGSKYREFRRFAELPTRAGQEMEVALKAETYRDDDPGIVAMRANGWTVADAGCVGDLDAYQAYIARSRAEIGIAKHAYVAGTSGWFSDRSAHFLASGKPVLAQSTGFERLLPTGEGIVTFRTMEEAQEGVARINGDYARHRRAARAFADEHLDYRRVLPALLEACS
jgi:hypothetical protein